MSEKAENGLNIPEYLNNFRIKDLIVRKNIQDYLWKNRENWVIFPYSVSITTSEQMKKEVERCKNIAGSTQKSGNDIRVQLVSLVEHAGVHTDDREYKYYNVGNKKIFLADRLVTRRLLVIKIEEVMRRAKLYYFFEDGIDEVIVGDMESEDRNIYANYQIHVMPPRELLDKHRVDTTSWEESKCGLMGFDQPINNQIVQVESDEDISFDSNNSGEIAEDFAMLISQMFDLTLSKVKNEQVKQFEEFQQKVWEIVTTRQAEQSDDEIFEQIFQECERLGVEYKNLAESFRSFKITKNSESNELEIYCRKIQNQLEEMQDASMKKDKELNKLRESCREMEKELNK